MQPQHTAPVRDAVDGRTTTQDLEAGRRQHRGHHHPSRWATPASRRRTDVFVVELDRHSAAAAGSADQDPLALTA
jgi:hypothetical protein